MVDIKKRSHDSAASVSHYYRNNADIATDQYEKVLLTWVAAMFDFSELTA